MAYDEGLAQRIRELLEGAANISERRMFGGLAFFADGGMALGIIRDELMVRVGPRVFGDALARPFARAMDFTGRRMRGFGQVAPEGFEDDGDLQFWIGLGIAYAVEVQASENGAGEAVAERVVEAEPATPRRAKQASSRRPAPDGAKPAPKAAAAKPPVAGKKSSKKTSRKSAKKSPKKSGVRATKPKTSANPKGAKRSAAAGKTTKSGASPKRRARTPARRSR